MNPAVAYAMCTGVVLFGLVIWSSFRRAQRTYPRSIVGRLQRTGAPVSVSVKGLRGTWNPAKRGAAARINTPGRATYSLDDQQTVHLTLESRAGIVQELSGPVPDFLLVDSSARRKLNRFLRLMFIGYGLMLLIGFTVGFLVAGPTVADRLVAGLVGLFVGMVVAALLVTFLRVVLAVGATAKRT